MDSGHYLEILQQEIALEGLDGTFLLVLLKYEYIYYQGAMNDYHYLCIIIYHNATRIFESICV